MSHPPLSHRPKNAREQLAFSLRRMRAERDWTQEDLSHVSGLDRSFIAHVERAARNISIDNIEKIANAFGVSIGDLF
ncbi:helix-turn-helix transcriptional regulator [Paraburkholderia bannensis]|uniref:helix-turn-helix transcriptional regulator n=1 Tax=Paraburkholderia bannensis TaxID=765414 RepID=UPI002ABDC224|nr:helix-turn-helix transcriptional regulator [Paraburkholderia bannensis]